MYFNDIKAINASFELEEIVIGCSQHDSALVSVFIDTNYTYTAVLAADESGYVHLYGLDRMINGLGGHRPAMQVKLEVEIGGKVTNSKSFVAVRSTYFFLKFDADKRFLNSDKFIVAPVGREISLTAVLKDANKDSLSFSHNSMVCTDFKMESEAARWRVSVPMERGVYTIRLGERECTIFAVEDSYNVRKVTFRNCFGAEEFAYIKASIKRVSERSAQQAKVLNELREYDINVTLKFEVEATDVLPAQMNQLMMLPASAEIDIDSVPVAVSELKVSDVSGDDLGEVKFTAECTVPAGDDLTSYTKIFTKEFDEKFV